MANTNKKNFSDFEMLEKIIEVFKEKDLPYLASLDFIQDAQMISEELIETSNWEYVTIRKAKSELVKSAMEDEDPVLRLLRVIGANEEFYKAVERLEQQLSGDVKRALISKMKTMIGVVFVDVILAKSRISVESGFMFNIAVHNYIAEHYMELIEKNRKLLANVMLHTKSKKITRVYNTARENIFNDTPKKCGKYVPIMLLKQETIEMLNEETVKSIVIEVLKSSSKSDRELLEYFFGINQPEALKVHEIVAKSPSFNDENDVNAAVKDAVKKCRRILRRF